MLSQLSALEDSYNGTLCQCDLTANKTQSIKSIVFALRLFMPFQTFMKIRQSFSEKIKLFLKEKFSANEKDV